VRADHDVEAAVRSALTGRVFAPARRSAGGSPAHAGWAARMRRRAGAALAPNAETAKTEPVLRALPRPPAGSALWLLAPPLAPLAPDP